MNNHPVWLIEVEEDLFLISFFQLYQSTRMMMLRQIICHIGLRNHRNTTHQTQWIEENRDLTSQMIWHIGMHYFQTPLIEVEEDLLFIIIIHSYQLMRMMTSLVYHHGNTPGQTQWIEEKWDLTLQMIWYFGMHNHPIWLIEVEEDLFLTPFNHIYLSTRMMMLRQLFCPRSCIHRNTTHQTQWIEENRDLTLQMMW